MKLDFIPWRLKRFLEKCGVNLFVNEQRYKPAFLNQCMDAKAEVNVEKPCTQSYDFLSEKCPSLLLSDQFIKLLLEKNSSGNLREEVLQRAKILCNESFPVYSENVPPLRDGFSWSKLEKLRPDDVMYRVRPHRFEFVPLLSLASLYGASSLELLDAAIINWMKFASKSKSNMPYLSNLVVIYRVIALTWSCSFIVADKNTDTSALKNSLLTNMLLIIKDDIRFLQNRLGKSHPNNHLLADYFAGWFIIFFFPDLVDEKEFGVYESMWLSELKRQYYSDGGNFEHSVHYHEFGCEMAAIYLVAKRQAGQPIDDEVEGLIERMLQMQLCLAGDTDRPWQIGDTTEDSLFPIPSVVDSTAVFSAIYKHFFMNDQFVADDAFINDIHFWLLGDKGRIDSLQRSNELAAPKINHFSDAGFYLFDDPMLESEYLFRTGVAVESKYMSGHMHTDCLSLYWRLQGTDLLAASGTYSYRYTNFNGVNFRKFFCSPSAHSCFVIQGEDQLGDMTGDFRDSDNGLRVSTRDYSNTNIGSWCEGTLICNNNYNGYKRGTVHILGYFTFVYDVIPPQIGHLEKGFGWQVASDVEVIESAQNIVELKSFHSSSRIVPAGNLESVHVTLGDETTPLGWVSKRYGEKEAAPYCYYPFDAQSGLTGFMLLAPERVGNINFDLNMCGESNLLATCKVEGSEYALLVCLAEQPFVNLPELPDFLGRLLLIEFSGGKPIKIKGLDVNFIRWPLYAVNYESEINSKDLEIDLSTGDVLIR